MTAPAAHYAFVAAGRTHEDICEIIEETAQSMRLLRPKAVSRFEVGQNDQTISVRRRKEMWKDLSEMWWNDWLIIAACVYLGIGLCIPISIMLWQEKVKRVANAIDEDKKEK